MYRSIPRDGISMNRRNRMRKCGLAILLIVLSHGGWASAAGTAQSGREGPVFVLDRARTMVYRGAIDDQYGLGYALSEPRQHYLIKALEAVLRDDRPDIQATTAPGCALSLGERTASATKVTYHNRISRIVQN